MYKLTDSPDLIVCLDNGTWIPRTYWMWLAEGNTPTPPPAPTMEELVAQTKAKMTAMLDAEVQTHGYDSIVSCVSYANSTDPVFKAEAEAAIAWRDAVYRTGYDILANVPEGVTTPDDVIALLPAMEWPQT